MKLACQLCFEGTAPNLTKSFSDEYFDDNTWSIINEVAPPFNETITDCKLFNKRIDCGKLFVPRTTERGLCYTFNTINADEMFADE